MTKLFTLTLILFAFFACDSVKKAEKPHLVTASDLVQFGFKLRDTSKISFYEFMDGTKEYDYSFENNELYISNTLSICKNKQEANLKYETYMTEIFSNGLDKENLNELYTFGDNSMFVLLKKNSTPVGNIFLYKKNNEVYFLSLIGVYFNSKKDWKTLLNHQPSSGK